jgi:Secretion system C-terminal sorting domain
MEFKNNLCILLFVSFSSFSQTVTQNLITKGIVTGNCPEMPNAYIGTNCFQGVARQISRSVNAENIVAWIIPNTCWGNYPMQGNFIQANCIAPYDKCWGHYCPDKYCDIIKSFVDVKASILLRAIGPWDNEANMRTGSDLEIGIKQLIVDVNASFDCANLVRPIIQGSIFEFCGKGVEIVTIPKEVIVSFIGTTGFDKNYYLDAQNNPKDLKFNLIRINHLPNSSLSNCPDISKIEARMWFYHCAKFYIDLGIQSIHLGQMGMWAKKDPHLENSNLLISKIREYAKLKNSFVLLTEETNKGLQWPNSNIFVFDFDTKVLWPSEIPFVGSSLPCDIAIDNYLINTPCENENFKAVIDDCMLNGKKKVSGFSPTGDCYYPYLPYNTYFDFGAGNHPPLGFAAQAPHQSVYGWDDTKWFSEKISKSCRKFWIVDAIERVRKLNNEFGFMSIPAVLAVKKPELYENYKLNVTPTADGAYILEDEPDILKSISKKWIANDSIQFVINKKCNLFLGKCIDNFDKKFKNLYELNIKNADFTSVYSIHIQNPDGTWLPFTYGSQRYIYPMVSGNYKIFVRKDNYVAFSDSSFSVVKEFSIYLHENCCLGFIDSNPLMASPNYEGDIEVISVNNNMSDFNNYINNKQYIHIQEENKYSTLYKSINNGVFSCGPNPIHDLLKLQFDNMVKETTYIKIFAMTGKLILNFTFDGKQDVELNVSSFNSGVYILVVNNTQFFKTEKIVKL